MLEFARVLVSLGLLFAVTRLAAVPVGEASLDGALRLSWRTVGPVVKVERPVEVDPSVPVHMRPPSTFERRPVPFRLVVALDGRVLEDRMVSPAGLRHDRPVVVQQEWPVAPGRHRVQVTFEAPGLRYALDREVTVEAGRIALVTLDEDAKRLQVR